MTMLLTRTKTVDRQEERSDGIRDLLDYNELLLSQRALDKVCCVKEDLADILTARDASIDLAFLVLDQLGRS